MTRFFKLSGGGNDFLALAEPESEPTPAEIAGWCARGLSAGADGLFSLRRRSAGGIEMRYFNSDGERAALCLNGTRCAARLAFELGWADEATRIETDAGGFAVRRAGPHDVEVDLPAPSETPLHLRLTHRDVVWDCWTLEVGVPHLIVFWDRAMAEAPIASVGPALRRHPALGDAGSNVDFARFTDRHRLEIRSFERGVEAETLACGTGVLACVAVGIHHGRVDLPVTALTRGGFEIGIAASNERDRWTMTGDARLVSSGELAPGASITPDTPDW
jgi:diaminopimelate epimerase